MTDTLEEALAGRMVGTAESQLDAVQPGGASLMNSAPGQTMVFSPTINIGSHNQGPTTEQPGVGSAHAPSAQLAASHVAPAATPQVDHGPAIDELRRNIASLTAQLNALGDKADAAALRALNDSVAQIERRLAALEGRPVPPDLSADVADLKTDVVDLKTKVAALEARPAIDPDQLKREATAAATTAVNDNIAQSNKRHKKMAWRVGAGGLAIAAVFALLVAVGSARWFAPDSSDQVAKLNTELMGKEGLKAKVEALEQRPQAPDLAPLSARVTALEQRPQVAAGTPVQTGMADVDRQAFDEVKTHIDQLWGRVAALEQQPASAPAPDETAEDLPVPPIPPAMTPPAVHKQVATRQPVRHEPPQMAASESAQAAHSIVRGWVPLAELDITRRIQEQRVQHLGYSLTR